MSTLTEQTNDGLAEDVMAAVSWADQEGDHRSYLEAVAALKELVRRASLKDTP